MDSRMNKIINKYNPANDIRLDGPPVTWDVMLLANTLDETITRLGMVTRAMVNSELVVRELRSNVQQIELEVKTILTYLEIEKSSKEYADFDSDGILYEDPPF